MRKHTFTISTLGILLALGLIYWYQRPKTYEQLAAEMRADFEADSGVRFSSHTDFVYKHRNYKKIVALGRPAVPLAMKDFQQRRAYSTHIKVCSPTLLENSEGWTKTSTSIRKYKERPGNVGGWNMDRNKSGISDRARSLRQRLPACFRREPDRHDADQVH